MRNKTFHGILRRSLNRMLKQSTSRINFLSSFLSLLREFIYTIFLLSILIGILFVGLYSLQMGIFPTLLNVVNISVYYILYFLVILSAIGIIFGLLLLFIYFLPSLMLLSSIDSQDDSITNSKYIKSLKNNKILILFLFGYFIVPSVSFLLFLKHFHFNFYYLLNYYFSIFSILVFAFITLEFLVIKNLFILPCLVHGISSFLFSYLSLKALLEIVEQPPPFSEFFVFLLFSVFISLMNAILVYLEINKEHKLALIIVALFFAVLIFYNKLYELPFRVLKFGDYEATLILDKNNPICPQKDKIKGHIIFSIGSQYIIELNIENNTKNCILYNGTITRIPKKFVLGEIIESSKDSRSPKKFPNKGQESSKIKNINPSIK